MTCIVSHYARTSSYWAQCFMYLDALVTQTLDDGWAIEIQGCSPQSYSALLRAHVGGLGCKV